MQRTQDPITRPTTAPGQQREHIKNTRTTPEHGGENCFQSSLFGTIVGIKLRGPWPGNVKLIMPVLAFAILSFGIRGTAQTAAKSCLQTDVQTAINSAARGATVTVPAGTCTWATVVTLTKGITLQGAGAASTVINNGVGDATVLQISPDSTAIANDETIKVTGFTFDGSGTGYGLIGI